MDVYKTVKTLVLLPIPLDNWEEFMRPITRFCDSWRMFQPDDESMELIALCCRNDPDNEVKNIFRELPVRFDRYDGDGADLGAHQSFAHRIGDAFLWCMTSRCYFHRPGWGRRMRDVRERNESLRLFGVSASHEGGKLHLCTRGHALYASDFRGYPTMITSRDQGVFFELGGGSLLEWAKKEGIAPALVFWNAVAMEKDWFIHANTFRDSDQSNMLVHDKHSDAFLQADDEERKRLTRLMLGV